MARLKPRQKKSSKSKLVNLHARIPSDEKEAAERAADRSNLTLTQWLRIQIRRGGGMDPL